MTARDLYLFTVYTKEDWWEGQNRAKQILNQKFATVLSDEDLSKIAVHKHKGFSVRPRMPASMKASGLSEVNIDKSGFHVSLDLDEFEVEEIKVKVFDRFVEVSGEHEERRDKYGLVSRKFVRRYWVPNDCDIDALTSSFSTDKQMTIAAPKNLNERKMFDLPMMVPIVEKKPNHGLVVEKEEFEEFMQKMVLENVVKTKGKPYMNLGDGEEVKLWEKLTRELYDDCFGTDSASE